MNNRIVIGALGLTIGLVTLGSNSSVSAHASSWHKGNPSFLVDQRYRTKYVNTDSSIHHEGIKGNDDPNVDTRWHSSISAYFLQKNW